MADADRGAVVLLAAGASTRMGRPKQLLDVQGRPLVRHAAETALDSGLGPVLVVLGAGSRTIAPALDGLPVEIVVNASWPEGLGSSVQAGVRRALAAHPDLPWVVLALADQPGVSAAHLRRLAAARRAAGRGIVASSGEGAAQPPALFTAAWFPRLLSLTGDAGARSLLRAEAARLARVPLDQPADLDTPDDYARYCARAAEPNRPNTA